MTTKVIVIHCGPVDKNVEVVEFTEHMEPGQQYPTKNVQATTVLQIGMHREVYVHDGRSFEVREVKPK